MEAQGRKTIASPLYFKSSLPFVMPHAFSGSALARIPS